MVYIIVLNWNGYLDTISCLESVTKLAESSFKVVVCDNNSSDNSLGHIQAWYKNNNTKNLYLASADYCCFSSPEEFSGYQSLTDKGFYAIQTGSNLGYAGGNNVGIRFALAQKDMSHVWVLNNDTEVDPHALSAMLTRCEADPSIGICGSKMVYFDRRDTLQGLGGVYNRWLGTTKHYAGHAPSHMVFDEDVVSKNIDYVIGASMLISRNLLEKVGLLCEDYFLYFEELDLTLRAKKKGFLTAVSINSVVFHKEGASVSRSDISDYYFVKNKFLITKSFFKFYICFVWCATLITLTKRIFRFELKKTINVLRILFGLSV